MGKMLEIETVLGSTNFKITRVLIIAEHILMCLYVAPESLEINHTGMLSVSICSKATVPSHLLFCSPPRA